MGKPPRFRRQMSDLAYWTLVGILMVGAVLLAAVVLLWLYEGG